MYKEIFLTVYGIGLISFFGLSFLSFMSDPITSAGWIVDGFTLMSILVAGFFISAYWWMRNNKKQELKH